MPEKSKQAAKKPPGSAETFKAFMNSAPDGLILLDSELNVLDINDSVLAFHPPRTRKEDVIGRHITEVVPDIRETGRYDKYLEVTRTGKPFFADDVVLHPKFGERHVAVRAFAVGKGVGIIVTDITERKRMEGELEASQARFDSVVNNSTDGILVIDKKGITRYVNPAAAALFSRSQEVLTDTPFGIPVVPGEKVEVDVVRSEGQAGVAEMRTADTDWEGKPACLAILRDISERHRIHLALEKERKELSRANQQLKELDRMKSEFISLVSHELRTPMTSIKSALGLFADGTLGALKGDSQKYVELMLRNVNRLAGLVNDVLDLSRIESGRLQLRATKTDLGALIADVMATFAPQAKKRQCVLAMEVSSEARHAYCDANRVTQVMTNLVGNALIHNPKGTRVAVGAKREGDLIWVWVRDNGKGIPREEQNHVFDRFYQVKRAKRDRIGGTGLGLAISKGLVEAHGGKLRLASEPGKGATFSFELQAAGPRARQRGRTQTWALKGLSVAAEQYGECVRLLLAGKFGAEHCAEFSRITAEIVEQWGKFVAVDLSGCEYLVSRSLGNLFELHSMLAERRGGMVFLPASCSAQDVMDLVGVSKLIPCYADLETALWALRNRKVE